LAGKVTKDLGVRLTADVKDLRRKLKGLEKDWQRYGKQIEQTNKRAARGRAGMGGVSAGGGLNRSIISGGAAVAGSLGLVAAARQAKAFEEQLVDLAVTGDKGRKWIARTRADVLKLSEQWTKSPEEITAGMQAIVAATGDADFAVQSMGLLTKAAFASGAEVEELSKVATDLIGMLKIKPEGLGSVLDNLQQQANLGAVEMKDMAQWFPVVLADMENFAWAGPDAAKGIGAFFQMAKRGNTNARNTAESMKIFNQMLAQNQEKIEKLLGVDLKKDGAWLALPDLLKTISQGYVDMERKGKKGLQGKFGLLFGQGKRALLPMIAQARAGFDQSVGGKAAFNELLNPTGARGAVDRMAKARAELSPIHKWNVAVAKMRAEMHRHMLPLLERLSHLMPTIAKAAKFALDNSEQLFAVWAGAKAASFFSKMIGAGKAMAGGAGGATAGGGGRYSRFSSSTAGSALRLGGKGAAIANAMGFSRGAFGGGGAERGLDAAATMATMAGGTIGSIVGGSYFLTKAAVSIVNSQFTGTLDYGKAENDLRASDLNQDLALRLGRIAPGQASGKTARPVTAAEQAAADKKATRLAELQKKQNELFGGKAGKGLLARIKADAAKPEAQKLKEKFASMTGGASFLGGGASAVQALADEAARSEQLSEQVKQQIAQIEEMKSLRKSIDKLATQGVNARITPESAKELAKATMNTARLASGKVRNDR
jgi:TP901 family phage tail tape measure protein